jgi:hypothetical protein
MYMPCISLVSSILDSTQMENDFYVPLSGLRQGDPPVCVPKWYLWTFIFLFADYSLILLHAKGKKKALKLNAILYKYW